MTSSNVLDLSSRRFWSDSRAQEMLCAGIKKDGFSNEIINQVRNVFDVDSPTSSENLVRKIKSLAGSVSVAHKVEFDQFVEYLEALILNNGSCYLRDTPEKARVIQWPNNPSSRINDPSSYVDIFQDQFYRTPNRFLTRDTPIGSLGSCFALRIAHQLQTWGYNYVVEEDDLPEDFPLDRLSETSYRMGPARTGTLWNLPSMRQVIERGFGEYKCQKLVITNDKNQLLDPFRTISAPLDETDYERDYVTHTAALRRALEKCDVMVLTLGLTEAWKFAHSDAYISVSPWKIDPLLLRQVQLSVSDNVAELERILAVYKKYKPNIKLIISVSPVPLNKTFSQRDHVVVANSYSKSVLRVAAQEFTEKHSDCCFYFPSYEAVMYGTKTPWESDMRHVSPEAIGRVMSLFQKFFLADQKPMSITDFREAPLPKKEKVKPLIRAALGPTLPIVRRIRARFKK